MKTCTRSIEIQAPAEKVFCFTTDPEKTPLWISGLTKEESSAFPPHIGTIYRNTADGKHWDEYTVVEFVPDQTFTLAKTGSTYRVKYTYHALAPKKTRLTYHEWVEVGELEAPFEQRYLEALKILLETSNTPLCPIASTP